MSTSEDPVDAAGPADWEAISLWLAQHAPGQEFLATLKAADGQPGREAVDRLAAISQLPGAPAALVAIVSGGYVGKLIQIARADTVNVILGASPITAPAQLPPTPPDFVDRAAELKRLRKALTRGRPEGRIFAITSQAGIGKSALAVRFAHEVLDTFPDAQLYVDLRGAEAVPADPAEVLDRFLRALGVPGDQIPPLVDERQALYRSLLFRRRALILLDNARDEQQIRLLLPGGPGCLVMATSRWMLGGLDIAEQVILEALSTRHAVELLARMAGEERISADLEAAEMVAQHCGHLPLALRIAGARLRSRPGWQVRDLADRLADEHLRLDELRAGDRDARGSFALSYRALTPPLARAFRLLGLAPGIDFGLPAAAAVLGCPLRTAGSVVEELVDVALLETAAAGRYRFHDLIRLFAREQAAADEDEPERQAALDRILRMYRDSASGWLDRALGEYRPHREAVAWFDADGLNALAAAEVAYQHGTWNIVTDLATALHHLLSLQGRATEMERLLSLAAAAAASAEDHRAEVHCLVLLAEFMLWHGRAAETQPVYDRALGLAGSMADSAARAWILTHRGDAYRESGDLPASRGCYEEALQICVADGDRARQGWVLTHLALTMRALRQPDAALDMFGQALAISAERNDAGNRAWILTHMAGALDDQSRTGEADAALREALGIMRRNNDLVGQEWVLEHSGTILLERQSWNAAAAVFRQAAGIAKRRSDTFAVTKWAEKANWASMRAS